LDIAQKDNILMVSPNSFYYFLKVILLGLESSQIERRTKHLLDILNALRQDSAGIGRELKVLLNHLTRTQNSVNRLSTDFERIVTKLNNIDLMKDETSI
jgi:DNA anti-recombination protein RmuC